MVSILSLLFDLVFSQDADELDPLVQILSIVVLRSAWVEVDAVVQGAMWQPLLAFIKGILNAFLWDLCPTFFHFSIPRVVDNGIAWD